MEWTYLSYQLHSCSSGITQFRFINVEIITAFHVCKQKGRPTIGGSKWNQWRSNYECEDCRIVQWRTDDDWGQFGQTAFSPFFSREKIIRFYGAHSISLIIEVRVNTPFLDRCLYSLWIYRCTVWWNIITPSFSVPHCRIVVRSVSFVLPSI